MSYDIEGQSDTGGTLSPEEASSNLQGQQAVPVIGAVDVTTDALQAELDEIKSNCLESLSSDIKNRRRRNMERAKTCIWVIRAQHNPAFDEIINHSDFANRKVKHGRNFSGVLKYLYGDLMSDQDRNKESRLLNALLKEYERNPEVYVHNGVEKLASYIESKGGFVNLVRSTYSKEEIAEDSENEFIDEISMEAYEEKQAKQANTIEAEIAGWDFKFKVIKRAELPKAKKVKPEDVYKTLHPLAVKKSKKAKAIASIGHAPYVKRTPDGYSLVLLKHGEASAEIVHDTIDQSLIDKFFVDAYSTDLNECAKPLRVICEVLMTQDFPFSGKLKKSDLVEVVRVDEEKKSILANQRMLFKHQGKALVYSAMHAPSGMITRAWPKLELLEEAAGDLAMSPISKNTVYNRLLCHDAYNHFDVDGNGVVREQGTDPTFTHTLRLKHKVSADNKVDLIFHSFEQDGQHNHSQLDLDDQWAAEHNISIPFSAAQSIGKSVANPWLSGIDDHILRPRNVVTKLAVTNRSLIVSFHREDKDMLQRKTFVYKGTDEPERVIQEMSFLSLEFMAAMANLSRLPITSDITFKFCKELLVLAYETDIATYELVIPTVDEVKKTRRTQGLVQYAPQARVKSPEEIEEERIDAIFNSSGLGDSFDEDVIADQQSEITLEI